MSESGDWPDVRLHIVTGKGGTGKTTVAAALALALASRGGDVLLCEVESRQGIAQIFDVAPLPYEERRIASGPQDGGDVYALAVDPEAALMEYFALYYHLGRAVRALDRFGVIDFATTLAPGVRDILLTGKVYEATKRSSRNKKARQYAAVVLDAPPTGRIANFLNVNSELGDLARMGPIKSQADSVMQLLRSETTAIHVVTLLEDMPVQETIDATSQLADAGLPMGGIVVNMARVPSLDDQAVDLARREGIPWDSVSGRLSGAGITPTKEFIAQLESEASDHAARLLLEGAQRARVRELELPTYELNRLPDGVDMGGLFELAAELTAQGLA